MLLLGRVWKRTWIRGSSAFSGRADSHFAVEKKSDDDNTIKITLTHEKSRRGKRNAPFSIILSEDSGRMHLAYDGEVEERKAKKEQAKNLIPKVLTEGGMNLSEIAEKVREILPIGMRNIQEALKELEKENVVFMEKQNKTNYYSLSSTDINL